MDFSENIPWKEAVLLKVAGVVAEYNPFHNGHAYHLQKTREAGATHIVAAMSGGFVQRGDIAVLSKFARARAAILGGADLVVEIPPPFALSSAATFARAGVWLLHCFGVQMLSFGSECGSVEILENMALQASAAESSAEMTGFLKEGMSYPRARAAAVSCLFGEKAAGRFSFPNDMLALEYLKSAGEISPGIELLALCRIETPHDSPKASGGYASASFLRKMLWEKDMDSIQDYVPSKAMKIYQKEKEKHRAPIFSEPIERLLLYHLRSLTAEGFSLLPDVSEGLENRLYRAAQEAESISGFCSAVKTKRYTLARIRRIVYCAALGITRQAQEGFPDYIRVLAFNQRGREILSSVPTACKIPVGGRFSELYRQAPKGIEYSVQGEDLVSLAMPSIPPSGREFTEKVSMMP